MTKVQDNTINKGKKPVLHTQYQQWLDETLQTQNMTLAQLGRAIQKDYNYIWRIGRGNPNQKKSRIQTRPGYDIALAIGNALGDPTGSLKAAGYAEPSSAGHRKIILGYMGQEPVELAVPQQATDDDISKLRALASVALQERGFTTEIKAPQ